MGLLEHADQPVECPSLLGRHQLDNTTRFSGHFDDALHRIDVSHQLDQRGVNEATVVF